MAATFVGGALGALARVVPADRWGGVGASWPWVTFTVNIVGAFVLGGVYAWFARSHALSPGRALWGTGFCGALTTFSTMQWELVAMAEAGAWTTAAAYLAASLLVGGAAVHVATVLVNERRP